MKTFLGLFLAWAVALSAAALATQQQQQQQPQQPAQQPPAGQPAPKPPRVLGQAQSQEEFDAWSKISANPAATPQEKAQLVEAFLEKYPESGLSAYAHQVAALAYQQMNNYDKFIHHSEKTLEELPDNPLILTSLAVAYAQKDGNADKAIEKADKGLMMLAALQKPAEVDQAQWDAQLDQLKSDAHYALGTAYLEKFSTGAQAVSDPHLLKAIENLEKAVSLDPRYDTAYYRLAFAYVKKNDAESALQHYARAIAVNGVVSSMARESLLKVYEFVNPKKQGEEDQQYRQRVSEATQQLVAQETEYLQKRIAEKQARLGAAPSAPPQQ